MLTSSNLTAKEKGRLDALARFQVTRLGNTPVEDMNAFTQQAIQKLIEVSPADKSDPEVDAALASLAARQGLTDIAENLAAGILNRHREPTKSWILAAQLSGSFAIRDKNMPLALAIYRKLSANYRDANDSYYLGICELDAGNQAAAIAAFERSIEIAPESAASHLALQSIYEQQGNQAKAEFHGAAGTRLAKYANP